MGAILNLWDFSVRSPEQVVRVFLELYDQEKVRLQLWEVFRGFAVNDDKGLLALRVEELDVALLFDQLVDLVGAVQRLKIEIPSGKCVFCGRDGVEADV
jgi:hypothetical protein